LKQGFSIFGVQYLKARWRLRQRGRGFVSGMVEILEHATDAIICRACPLLWSS
jgi:hypothetical protein